MLRRTHPQPVESIDMLREKNLKKFTEVYTSDNKPIGLALRFVHRPIEDVNVDQELYRTYLVVQSIEFGGPVFVPTPFVEEYDPDSNRLILAVDLDTVENEVWNREPTFVARGQSVPEELPVD